jgi:CRISPR/Cas system-associated endonuclease Cas1
MLTYAYRALESQVRIATVAAELDPTMGYLHAQRPGRVALVYDLMEPLRPQVDHLVLDFVQGRTFDPRDFVLTDRGICRLHPQLARTVAGLTVGGAAVKHVVLTVARELTRVKSRRIGAPRAPVSNLIGHIAQVLHVCPVCGSSRNGHSAVHDHG